MTFYQSLAVVLLRVWAAVFLVGGVSYLLSIIGVLLDPRTHFGTAPEALSISELVQLAVYYGIGLALWFFARPLGKRIGAGFSAPTSGIAIDGERLIQIGAFLIGLFYLVEYGPRGVADLAATFVRIARQTDAERLTGSVHVYIPGWREQAAHWGVIATALVIAFRARDFAKLFSWLRQAGQYREKSETGGGAGKSVAGE